MPTNTTSTTTTTTTTEKTDPGNTGTTTTTTEGPKTPVAKPPPTTHSPPPPSSPPPPTTPKPQSSVPSTERSANSTASIIHGGKIGGPSNTTAQKSVPNAKLSGSLSDAFSASLSPTSNSPANNGGLVATKERTGHTGLIVGLVVGGIAFVLLISILFCIIRSKLQQRKQSLSVANSSFGGGAAGVVSRSAISRPLPSPYDGEFDQRKAGVIGTEGVGGVMAEVYDGRTPSRSPVAMNKGYDYLNPRAAPAVGERSDISGPTSEEGTTAVGSAIGAAATRRRPGSSSNDHSNPGSYHYQKAINRNSASHLGFSGQMTQMQADPPTLPMQYHYARSASPPTGPTTPPGIVSTVEGEQYANPMGVNPGNGIIPDSPSYAYAHAYEHAMNHMQAQNPYSIPVGGIVPYAVRPSQEYERDSTQRDSTQSSSRPRHTPRNSISQSVSYGSEVAEANPFDNAYAVNPSDIATGDEDDDERLYYRGNRSEGPGNHHSLLNAAGLTSPPVRSHSPPRQTQSRSNVNLTSRPSIDGTSGSLSPTPFIHREPSISGGIGSLKRDKSQRTAPGGSIATIGDVGVLAYENRDGSDI